MEERRRVLVDQPVAVLRVHAQECGVDVSGCLEKEELVRRILQAEPSELVGGAPRAPPSRERSEADARRLREDEELARRLQADENRDAEDARGRHGVPLQPRDQALLGALSQLFALGSQPGLGAAARPGGHDQQAAPPPPGAAAAYLAQALDPSRGLQDSRDAAPSPGPPGAAQAGQPRPEQGLPLAELLALLGATAHAQAGRPQGDQGGQIPEGLAALVELLSQGGMPMNRGVDEATIESRSATTTFSEREAGAGGEPRDEAAMQCMVCLEGFQAGDEIRILPCLHRFHRSCVDQWLAQVSECPICKHDILGEGAQGL